MGCHVRHAPRPGGCCVRCGEAAVYCRTAAGVWRGFGIARKAGGAVVALVPGRGVPLCLGCAGSFDPRCVLPWDAPPWVVQLTEPSGGGSSKP